MALLSFLMTVLMSGCASPQPRSQQTGVADDSARVADMNIEVLGFTDCPNTQPLLDRVERAVDSLNLTAEIRYVDQEQLAEDDRRRHWPAPTVLVEGNDLFGLTPPESSSPGCRIYPGGLPDETAISFALQSFLAR